MQSNQEHLLIATVEDADSPAAWSGTPYHMVNALREEFARVTVLQTLRSVKRPLPVLMRLLRGQAQRPLWMSSPTLRHCGGRLRAAVSELQPSHVLSISSQHLIHAGPLGCPTYMVSDAPWMAYKEAYARYEPLPDLATRYARLEAQAARDLSGLIFPTPWACEQARERYGVPASHVHCLPFGANRASPLAAEVLDRQIDGKPGRSLNLLFVGRDWVRKGGPLALEALAQLHARGLPARLVVIGCTPEVPQALRSWVDVLGFLSPAQPSDQQRLEQAYRAADLFLLPSQAECYGLVFAEAQSWGLPCVALAVQGVPGVVVDGMTGRLCPPDADGLALAQAIEEVLASPHTYRRLARAALQHARQATTWPAFAAGVRSLLMGASQP